MKPSAPKNLASLLALLLGLLLLNPAFAGKPVKDPEPTVSPLATDLQALLTEASALNTRLAGISLGADNLCGELLAANQAANAQLDNIANVDASLAAPLTLDADILQALEDLSGVYVSLGSEAVRLSTDLDALTRTLDQLSIAQGISAMLRLSDDIGTMADRIGEMADRILIMADNIGLMADQILLTQQIQNSNVALTQQNILTAQTNVLNLVAQSDTSAYDLDLANQLSLATLLEVDMNAVLLSAENAAGELAAIETDVDALKTLILNTDNALSTDAASNTLYINQQSLITLLDLSGKLGAFAVAVQGYAVAIDGLNAISATPTLTDSVGSVLRLSDDIGVMAGRIGEQADLILAMADNIGVQSDQILLTQQQQSLNVAATQAALLQAQELMIGLIVAYGL
jgi:hypothetical protein